MTFVHADLAMQSCPCSSGDGVRVERSCQKTAVVLAARVAQCYVGAILALRIGR